MIEGLTYWHWFALSLIFMIAETLGAGGLLVALGMAAALTAIVTYIFLISWEWQLVIFSLLSVLSALTWWYIILKKDKASPTLINKPLEAMVGRTASLVQPITNGRGKIIINDAHWFVTGPDLPKGATVKIIGVADDMLIIEPVE